MRRCRKENIYEGISFREYMMRIEKIDFVRRHEIIPVSFSLVLSTEYGVILSLCTVATKVSRRINGLIFRMVDESKMYT
jgi:hypothetical protein